MILAAAAVAPVRDKFLSSDVEGLVRSVEGLVRSVEGLVRSVGLLAASDMTAAENEALTSRYCALQNRKSQL